MSIWRTSTISVLKSNFSRATGGSTPTAKWQQTSSVFCTLVSWTTQVSAEPHLRAAYQLNPTVINLSVLTYSLQIMEKGDDIARIANDYTACTGQESVRVVLATHAVRRDWRAMLQALERYDREGTLSRARVAS